MSEIKNGRLNYMQKCSNLWGWASRG